MKRRAFVVPAIRGGVLAISIFAAVAVTPGCNSGPVTAIVVVVNVKDIRVGGEINHLTLRVTRVGKPEQKREYELVEDRRLLGAGELALPAELEIEKGFEGLSPVALTVEAKGYFDAFPIVSRAVRVNFVEGTVTRVPLDLDLRCVASDCGEGKTCLPRFGCQPIPASDAVNPIPNGPICDCDSFFPICVGATWSYFIRNPDTKVESCKTWAIGDSKNIKHENEDVWAFMQLRLTALDRSRKWLIKQAGMLFWKKDESFDLLWNPLGSREYVPSKLRLDENPPSVPWPPLPYDVYVSEGPQDLTTAIEHHEDQWDVVSLDQIVRTPGDLMLVRDHLKARGYVKDHAELFRWDDTSSPGLIPILCRHRVDQAYLVMDGGKAGQPQDATYCFAQGIGKIWEFTQSKEEEWLLGFDVPGSGCTSFTPAAASASYEDNFCSGPGSR